MTQVARNMKSELAAGKVGSGFLLAGFLNPIQLHGNHSLINKHSTFTLRALMTRKRAGFSLRRFVFWQGRGERLVFPPSFVRTFSSTERSVGTRQGRITTRFKY